MKACTRCHELKDDNDFFVKDSRSNKLHAQCKLCHKEQRKTYHRQHYQKYKESYKTRANQRKIEVQRELRTKMLQYLKDKHCEICHENDNRVLDFDHIVPTQKTFSIARAITNCVNWDKILAEIKKCRILCANCHRKHTANQQGWYRTDSK